MILFMSLDLKTYATRAMNRIQQSFKPRLNWTECGVKIKFERELEYGRS